MQKIIYIFFLVFFNTILLVGQNDQTYVVMVFDGDNDEKQAQVLAQARTPKVNKSAQSTDIALTQYTQTMNDTTMELDDIINLANKHRLQNELQESEYWYTQFVTEKTQPIYMLHYAKVLEANGKCADAIRWYRLYNKKQKKKKDRISIPFEKDCQARLHANTTENVQLYNLNNINTEKLDFMAIPYKNGIVFTSTRGTKGIIKRTDRKTKDHFSDLFYSERLDNGNYLSPIPFGGVNRYLHDGVASFDKKATTMFFSRSNSQGKNEKGVVDLKIYTAFNNGKTWSRAKELPFNDPDFSSCHPSVSPDGTRLYFASNRPGGFGGMDIYLSILVDGQWQAPINLGPTINTTGNELFPVIGADDVLYFASNGHEGLGALDIFAAMKSDAQDELSWTERRNMGQPFNSESDDFGFFVNADNQTGFLTSNRVGGQGGDDIYEWQTPEKLLIFDKNPLSRVLTTLDAATQMRVNDALITIEHAGYTNQYTSDKNGQINWELPTSGKFKITIEKEGYKTIKKKIAVKDVLKENTGVLDFEMKRVTCSLLYGTVLDVQSQSALQAAKIMLHNTNTGEKEVIQSNATGTFDVCIACGDSYKITATKKSYKEQVLSINVPKQDCGKALPQKLNFKLNSIAATKKEEATDLVLKKLAVEKDSKLEVGKNITLNNLYYNLNEATIRKDASLDLDYVVELMNLYPNMRIELAAHTDSRGSSAYNQKLSEQRAKEAVQYLVKKGIDSSRLVAKGYGETQLLNACVDGVPCEDSAHQMNRRTEVRILKM